MSMRGWSGALPNVTQSIPTLKGVRRALCQVRCPERNKEKIDDHPLFVSPCVLSTPVYIMQECNNKVVQKSRYRILVSSKIKQKNEAILFANTYRFKTMNLQIAF